MKSIPQEIEHAVDHSPSSLRSPTISVIIPTLNEAENLVRAIASVAWADEIIVVDGGSDDQSEFLIESLDLPHVRFVDSAPGRGVQLSLGVEVARGDLLIFLHADNSLGETTQQQLLEHAELMGPHLYGCFRQKIDNSGLSYRLLEWGNAFRADRLKLPYGDQAVFVDRETYDSIGGFHAVPIMEDVLFAKAMRPTGLPLKILPGPVAVSARRWERCGVIRQTLRNWFLLIAFKFGVSHTTIQKWYRGAPSFSEARHRHRNAQSSNAQSRNAVKF